MKSLINFAFVAFILTSASLMLAQTQPNAVSTALRVKSPEISADHQVTFRLFAPNAATVTLNGSWLGAINLPMTKDEAGIWWMASAHLILQTRKRSATGAATTAC